MSKISIVLPSLKFGGAERLHINLAEDWTNRGHEVEFILMQKEGEYLSIIPPKVNVISLEVSRLRHVLFPLTVYLRKSRPDYILAAMWPLTSYVIISWILSGRIGKMYVSDHVQLSVAAIHEILIPKLYLKIFIRFIYPFANGIIAVSNGVKKDLCNIGHLKNKQVEVIYNPVSLGVLASGSIQEERVRLWGKGHTYNILAVGELKKQKDHKNLLKSFSLLVKKIDAKLVILGEGSLRESLSLLIKQLNLGGKVDLPGFVHNPYPWYHTADLFVLSSQWEGFGNVIVEALDCGVPVVSTDCPSGPSEILDNGRYGRLVPVGDSFALASAMKASLSQPYDRASLMKRAEDFSVPRISGQYLDYFST